MLGDWFASDAATVYGEASKTVAFRRVTNTGGAINPVSGAITVSTSAAIGASTVTLTAPAGTWALEVGDTFTNAGTVHTVTARTVSASGKFTNVPVTPALAAPMTAGQGAAFTWAADYPVRAIIGGYESRMIDGTVITVKDLRCLMQPTATDGRTIPTPGPLDKIGIDGAFRTVGVVAPQYAGASVSLWDICAKG